MKVIIQPLELRQSWLNMQQLLDAKKNLITQKRVEQHNLIVNKAPSHCLKTDALLAMVPDALGIQQEATPVQRHFHYATITNILTV